jgi:hypothetical protein
MQNAAFECATLRHAAWNKACDLLGTRAMQSTLIKITLIATALIGANAYLRKSPVTAEDLRIGRQAMPISEVKLMLHGGSSQDSIIDDVKRRHIPEKINAAMEIELTESGAKPALIAALKDGDNILTRNQKDAFDKRMELADTTRQSLAATQSSVASAQANAERQEHQRQASLQQEILRNSERKEQEQALKDREMAASHSWLENHNIGGVHGIIRRGDVTDGYGHVINRRP